MCVRESDLTHLSQTHTSLCTSQGTAVAHRRRRVSVPATRQMSPVHRNAPLPLRHLPAGSWPFGMCRRCRRRERANENLFSDSIPLLAALRALYSARFASNVLRGVLALYGITWHLRCAASPRLPDVQIPYSRPPAPASPLRRHEPQPPCGCVLLGISPLLHPPRDECPFRLIDPCPASGGGHGEPKRRGRSCAGHRVPAVRHAYQTLRGGGGHANSPVRSGGGQVPVWLCDRAQPFVRADGRQVRRGGGCV